MITAQWTACLALTTARTVPTTSTAPAAATPLTIASSTQQLKDAFLYTTTMIQDRLWLLRALISIAAETFQSSTQLNQFAQIPAQPEHTFKLV